MNNLPIKKGFKYYNDVPLNEMHSAGRAIGKTGNRNIYVDFGIPGENANIEVAKHQKNGRFVKGTIHSLNSISPFRVVPFCKHSGNCGGCNWQHIDYKVQLELKKSILLKALSKYEIKTPTVHNVVPSPLTLFYRNKLEYSFSSQNESRSKNDSKNLNVLGFHQLNHPGKVVDIEECYLHSSSDNVICEEIRKFALINNYAYYNYKDNSGLLKNIIIRTSLKKQVMVIIGFANNKLNLINAFLTFLNTRFPEISSLNYYISNCREEKEIDIEVRNFSGEKVIYENIEDLKFQISPFSFYQPNPLQAINIYSKIREYAQLRQNEIVYDLYTGIGTIACYLSRDADKVIGIEGSASAINDANYNAKLNNIQNIEFITGDILETFNQDFLNNHCKPDVIILDPPRSGTLIEIKKTILLAKPSRIIYVSCNPVSLAWDLKQLTEKYNVTTIQPFDMFPHTHHLETVVLLTIKK